MALFISRSNIGLSWGHLSMLCCLACGWLVLAWHGICPVQAGRGHAQECVSGIGSYCVAGYTVDVVQVLTSLWTELQEWGRKGTAKWLGYLSSTSVYGDWGGAWVDERCAHLLS